MRTKKYLIIFLSFFSLNIYSSSTWNYFPTTIYLHSGDSLNGCALLYEISEDNLLVTNYSIGFCSSIQYLNSKVDTNYYSQKNRVVFSEDIQSDTMIKWIKIKRIKSAKMYIDEKKQFFFEYKNLYSDNTLWKLLKFKDSVGIYNDLIFPFEKNLGGAKNMVLLTPNGIIEIYTFSKWFLSNSRVDKLMVRFINKRYNKSFVISDFRNIDEMFNYILENK